MTLMTPSSYPVESRCTHRALQQQMTCTHETLLYNYAATRLLGGSFVQAAANRGCPFPDEGACNHSSTEITWTLSHFHEHIGAPTSSLSSARVMVARHILEPGDPGRRGPRLCAPTAMYPRADGVADVERLSKLAQMAHQT